VSTARDASRVSAIVAVRDGERYLAQALDSILGQSVPPGEVVVVDDGSKDATPAVLDAYAGQIRVVRQEPRGFGAAVNRGVATSTGELLAFLDGDDAWAPASLAVRLARLIAPDRPDAVFGRMTQFVSPELDPAAARAVRFDPGPARAPMFQTMLIRRRAFDRVGPLSTDYVIGANVDWMSRARAAGLRAVDIEDVVGLRRIHASNLSRTARERQTVDLVRAVREHRRRNLAK
jgi:glycosyltransferase involved in cell wall biosynthesis